MRHNGSLLALLIAGGGFISCPARAATGKAGAELLQQTFGARPFAMGQAYSALADDAFGLSYNPATLSRLKRSELSTQYVQSVVDAQLGYAVFATPLSPNQALGIGVGYMDLGKTDIFDDTGASTGRVNAQHDFLVHGGYAHSFPFGSGRLHLGAAGKLFRSVIFNSAQTSAFASDIGALHESRWGEGLVSLGLAAVNLGPSIKYTGGLAGGSQSDPLPLTLRAAAGYSRRLLANDALSLGLEADHSYYDKQLSSKIGLEYLYHGICALRFGYIAEAGVNRLSIGVGVNVSNLSVDYGFGLAQALGNLQQMSLSYHFTIPGIRYNDAAAPSPLDKMISNVQRFMKDGRYFDAAAETQRIREFFPESDAGASQRRRIDIEMERAATSGERGPRYAYALAFQRYFDGAWADAVRELRIALEREPDNSELRAHLKKAKSRLDDSERQLRLQKEAITGTLFALAHQTYEARDYARAQRIISEILRIGPYQPALSLRARIQSAQRQSRPSAAAPPVKEQTPAALPAASAQRPRPSAADQARAEQLYNQSLSEYGANNLSAALRDLEEAYRLNADNEYIKNTLDTLRRESLQRQTTEPRP